MATGVINFNDGFVDTPGFRLYAETPNYTSERVLAFTSAYYYPATPFFLGVKDRTATGSGTGSSTAIGDVIAIVEATATGSGTGSATTAILHILPRTATGSGTGSGLASANPVQGRIATGSGVGSGTTTRILIAKRTATGSGVGTSSASTKEVLPRTATGSGQATAGSTGIGVHIAPRTATGSGTGTQSATKNQLYLFRTPTDNRVQWARFDGEGVDHALFKFYTPGARGRNVYKLTDGTWTENEQRDYSLVSKIYFGGHDILVDATERAELEAAGYGDYVS